MLDGNGEAVLEVSRLRMGSGASKSGDRNACWDRLLTVAWEQRQPPTAPVGAGVWLLTSPGDADASRDDLLTDLADALSGRWRRRS